MVPLSSASGAVPSKGETPSGVHVVGYHVLMSQPIQRETMTTNLKSLDTKAINEIASILNENEDWSTDELDAIAKVLDLVRSRVNGKWDNGQGLVWQAGHYHDPDTLKL